jgi:hypothetical protein
LGTILYLEGLVSLFLRREEIEKAWIRLQISQVGVTFEQRVAAEAPHDGFAKPLDGQIVFVQERVGAGDVILGVMKVAAAAPD